MTDGARKLAERLWGSELECLARDALIAQADEIERKDRMLHEEQQCLTATEMDRDYWKDQATSAEAALAKAKDALREIDGHIINDNGDVTWSPLKIRETVRATLASIDAGEEHPDSVRLVHDAKAWKMVAQTMERSRDDVRSALKELLDAYSACFPPGNPWGDKARKTLGINAPVFEGHDPTSPFAPRERPKKSIRLMTDAERRAAGLDPNGGFDGPTGAD